MNTKDKYDSLARYFGRSKDPYPVHKSLNLPREQNHTGFSTVNDWLIQNIDFAPGEKVLDAGCGVGYTLVELCRRYPLKGTGITLSAVEKERAEFFAGKRGLEKSLGFRRQSYDDPIKGKFNTIIAIESLKHSNNLAFSINNLAKSLQPGGRMIIAEDLWLQKPRDDRKLRSLHGSMSFRHDYSLPDYRKALEEAGLELEQVTELNPYIKSRKAWKIRFLIFLSACLKKLFFTGPLHRMYFIFHAGFIFEDYYRKNMLQYSVLEARLRLPESNQIE